MFRCSECGLEYDVKPDFCDCGNDIFEEILQTNTESKSQKKQTNISNSDLLSWLIFGICIILSILVLFFFPKIEEKPEQPSKPVLEKPTEPIPDINTIWKDSTPQENVNLIEQIKEVVFKPKPEPVIVQPKPKPQPKPVAKTQQPKAQQTQQTQKPKQQTKTQQKPKTVTTPTVGKQQSSSYNYEIVNYRTALRQRLFSNLDLYKIEGSGTCGIEFSIDENGKLLNRNFTFLSDNKSVNDEVYKMLMRTARFNPPPSSYANKLIKMTFKLTSDSYEINFTN